MRICKLPGGSISFDEDGSVQPHDYGGWLGPHIPLIAGIAAADAITEGVTAKKGEKLKEGLKGLAKGTLYGAVLHGVEHKMDLSGKFSSLIHPTV